MTYEQAIQGKRTVWFTLTKQWWDMIHEGIKKEEYRAMTEYWTRRLFKPYDFDVAVFRNGYGSNDPTMVVEVVKQPTIGEGRTEWGAEEGKKYFVTTLGRVLWSSEMKVAE